MLQRISSRELSEWRAYLEIEAERQKDPEAAALDDRARLLAGE